MKTAFLAGFGILMGIAAAGASPAASPGVQIPNIRAGETTGRIVVPIDKSQLLRFERPFREISVGNRDIAEVQPLTHTLIYVLGKKLGTTNLTITGRGGAVIAVVDVAVSYDIDGLRRRLHEMLPGENVTVAAAGDAIALTGEVSSADHLHKILETAEHYAPGKVSNLLSVAGSQQVLLRVKFAEVKRSALKNIDMRGAVNYVSGNDSVLSGWGPAFPDSNGHLDAAKAFGGAVGTFLHGNFTILAGIQALEQKGLARTLAEPNLVALSGDTANFLAGGEIPIPVAQTLSGSTNPVVTVQYKQFGVSLAFTPTIVGKALVNLVLKSEVSALDNTNGVTANGFQIPALTVRRATTTVELKDGQSFAVAGLLQDDFVNGTSQLPFLGNVPILGALFRSWNYSHKQTDLVMIVTVHIVAPTVAKNLSTPLDGVILPTPLEHFGTGTVEKRGKPAAPGSKDKQGYVLP